MSKSLELLGILVQQNQNSSMSAQEWVDFMTTHKSTVGILSAATRSGHVDSAILEANNFPDAKEFSISEKDKVESGAAVVLQFQVFARWLIESGRKFGFSVLGVHPQTNAPAPKTPPAGKIRKTAKRKTGKKSGRVRSYKFRKNTLRSRADRTLRRVKHIGLVKFIQQNRAEGLSDSKIAAQIKRLTGVALDGAQVWQVASRFKIA